MYERKREKRNEIGMVMENTFIEPNAVPFFSPIDRPRLFSIKHFLLSLSLGLPSNKHKIGKKEERIFMLVRVKHTRSHM